MPTPPPLDVLEAFGANADPHLLDGGQGQTWRSGEIVLKPVSLDAESHWRATVLDRLPESDAIRVARPIRAASGDWLFQGWEASHRVAGRTDPTRWDEAIATGSVFHQALADVPRPSFLDDRDNLWTRADRISWDPEPLKGPGILRQLAQCRDPAKASEAESQVVHGDLLGNVLYEPGLPPAIIDWAPYWRPAAWAAAVAAVDAMCWHGAPVDAFSRNPEVEAIRDRADRDEYWAQMLIRALLFRMITDQESARESGREWEPHPAYRPVATALVYRVDAAASAG